MRTLFDKLFLAGILLLAIGLPVGLIGLSVYQAIAHPCVKYGEPKTCVRYNTFCYSKYVCETTPENYTCTECLERKP